MKNRIPDLWGDIQDALLVDSGCFIKEKEDDLEKSISEFDEAPNDDE